MRGKRRERESLGRANARHWDSAFAGKTAMRRGDARAKMTSFQSPSETHLQHFLVDSRRVRVAFAFRGKVTVGKIFDHYRPERHYMRGPGPKWHEKHDGQQAEKRSDSLPLPLATWLLPAATAALLGLVAMVTLA
jgi:hypothetical protein